MNAEKTSQPQSVPVQQPVQVVAQAAHSPVQRHAQIAAQSPRVAELNAYAAIANGSPVIQRQSIVQGSPVVQRVVVSKRLPMEDGTQWVRYYSTLDTGEEFDTVEEAQAHEAELGPNTAFDRTARYPTNYSYYHADARNIIGLSDQGPHTLSHCALSYRLDQRLAGNFDLAALRQVAKDQVLSLEDFTTGIDNERLSTLKPAMYDRMLEDYRILLAQLQPILDGDNDFDRDVAYELVMRLMQMDPYCTYHGMSKRALKNKHEQPEDAFKDAFDSGARFKNMEGFENYKARRVKLWPEGEEMPAPKVKAEKPEKPPKARRSTKESETIDSSSAHDRVRRSTRSQGPPPEPSPTPKSSPRPPQYEATLVQSETSGKLRTKYSVPKVNPYSR